jgi:hypothetical protein
VLSRDCHLLDDCGFLDLKNAKYRFWVYLRRLLAEMAKKTFNFLVLCGGIAWGKLLDKEKSADMGLDDEHAQSMTSEANLWEVS